MLQEKHIEDFVVKYIKEGDVVAIGTSYLGEDFLKKLALEVHEKNLNVSFIPTSTHLGTVAASMKLPLSSLNENEVDVAIEFADSVDDQFNYVKRDTHSLIRDKMIAQSAATMIVVSEAKHYVKDLSRNIPFEVSNFAWKRTMIELEKLGSAEIRKKGKEIVKTETGNYIIDVEVDDLYSLDDLNFNVKIVPGIFDSGLFMGYADKIILHDESRVEVKSRTEFKDVKV